MSTVFFEKETTNSAALRAENNAATAAAADEYGYEATEDVGHEHSMRNTSERSIKRRGVVTAEDTLFDISYHPGRIKFYSPPRQRQRWGDTQVLPRTNWGDLFFDLFFVAATYNVSYILVENPSFDGALYAAGTFLPVMGIWLQKMTYDARFVYEDDIYHRLLLIGLLVILAAAVLSIRPVAYMSNPEKSNTMAGFSFFVLLERLMAILLCVELYYFGVGQKENLQRVSLTTIRPIMISVVFYAAATILAGLKFYSEGEHGIEEDDYRFLAEEKDSSSKYDDNDFSNTDIPILLVLVGHVGYILYLSITVVFFFPSGGRHKEFTVPANIEFIMHRYGEWTMLMLGESVFSLLIVYVPNKESGFYETFYCGILTVCLLQYLHFKSEPDHPDHHATRRHKNAGMGWMVVQQIYALSLVALGAAYTILLMSFADDDGRRLETDERELAGGESVSEETLENAADLFSASLGIIFVCLDISTLLHVGIKEGRKRCVCKNTKKKNVKGIFLLFLRIALAAFAFTLSKWQQDPSTLSLIGLFCVLGELILRKLGGLYLSHNQVHAIDH